MKYAFNHALDQQPSSMYVKGYIYITWFYHNVRDSKHLGSHTRARASYTIKCGVINALQMHQKSAIVVSFFFFESIANIQKGNDLLSRD